MKTNQKRVDLSKVLKAKYEKFNLCFEAAYKGRNYEERDEYRQVIKSVKEISLKPEGNQPETHALIAYMLLRASRLRAIINNVARVPDLRNQNRLLWDKRMIQDGLDYINKSAGGNEVSEYHLRAGINACYVLAKDYESTDWQKIISLYDQYLEINSCLEIALERADLISELEGPKAAIETILKIDTKNNSTKIKALNSSLAGFHMKLNEYEQAIERLLKSHDLSEDDNEKSSYLNKIEFCKQQIELSKKYDQVLSF